MYAMQKPPSKPKTSLVETDPKQHRNTTRSLSRRAPCFQNSCATLRLLQNPALIASLPILGGSSCRTIRGTLCVNDCARSLWGSSLVGCRAQAFYLKRSIRPGSMRYDTSSTYIYRGNIFVIFIEGTRFPI